MKTTKTTAKKKTKKTNNKATEKKVEVVAKTKKKTHSTKSKGKQTKTEKLEPVTIDDNASNSNTFSVVFNHGGEFVREDNNMFYRGGVQTVISNENDDEWCKAHLINLVMGWGYEKHSFKIWTRCDGQLYVEHNVTNEGSDSGSDYEMDEGMKFSDSEDERGVGLDDGFMDDGQNENDVQKNMNLILSTIGCNENENDFDDKGYKSEELGSSDPDVSGEERGPRDSDRQYALLRRYAEELKKQCKHNSITVGVERPNPTLPPRFGSFYFCFDGCKKGFIHGCRPFIGVDGCHLKTKYGGQLLIAVGRDPNDQYFPLAFGVVETETKESWRWFLQQLMDDVGQDNRFVFILDQQKGLVAVFEEMFARIEHRLCLRHLYANFKKFGGGTLIRDLMMGAAKATYYQAWEAKMNELKAINGNAWEWVMGVPTKMWCKHAFSFYPKCDVLMNNLSESFNATILVARDKPILTLCEWIMMYRMSSSVKKLEKWPHKICPMPQRRLHKEVMMAALGLSSKNPIDYVYECYSRDKYAKCYGFAVSAINGVDMWPKPPEGVEENILPPMYKNGPGRPRKLRIREVGEEGSRRRRKGVVYLCTKCSKPGHNAGSCKSKEQDPNRLKRKRKPPKGKGKEAANPTNPTAPANPTTQAAGVEASQVAEANPTAPVTQETVMVEASQVVDANPPDTSAVPDTNAPDQVGDTSAVPMDATHDEVVEASQVVDATHDQASQE
ncbi:hypothetical protein QL285_045255 [Trifolium repens]|nr:hypothetical protein QL285_045255 [Trifolium repens]